MRGYGLVRCGRLLCYDSLANSPVNESTTTTPLRTIVRFLSFLDFYMYRGGPNSEVYWFLPTAQAIAKNQPQVAMIDWLDSLYCYFFDSNMPTTPIAPIATAPATLPIAAVFSCSRFFSSSASILAKCNSLAMRAPGFVRKIASHRDCDKEYSSIQCKRKQVAHSQQSSPQTSPRFKTRTYPSLLILPQQI